MAFLYAPPGNAELRQGEIIGPVWEHRVRHPAQPLPNEAPIVDTEEHARMLVMTAECDLWKDFRAKQENPEATGPDVLHQILLCDVYFEEDLAAVLPPGYGGRDRRSVNQNQNERYHCFPLAGIENTETQIPKLFMDFKRCISLSTNALYGSIRSGASARIARVPDVFVQDLMHRLYNFLSRVGPDFE